MSQSPFISLSRIVSIAARAGGSKIPVIIRYPSSGLGYAAGIAVEDIRRPSYLNVHLVEFTSDVLHLRLADEDARIMCGFKPRSQYEEMGYLDITFPMSQRDEQDHLRSFQASGAQHPNVCITCKRIANLLVTPGKIKALVITSRSF